LLTSIAVTGAHIAAALPARCDGKHKKVHSLPPPHSLWRCSDADHKKAFLSVGARTAGAAGDTHVQWSQYRNHSFQQEILMSAIRNDKKAAFPAKKEGGKLDLSVNKENLKHLKVRTDLKGGLLAQLAVARICSGCHGCG
jgi:hypothetical protein